MNHAQQTKAVEIVTYLGRNGYRIGYDRQRGDVKISPQPPEDLAKRIIANEQLLVDLLFSLESPPATAHAFVAPFWTKREGFRDLGACIACGIPWIAHGEPPIAAWDIVEDANVVRPIVASPLPVECPCGELVA